MKKQLDWSINLEADEYENNRELIIEDSIKAIEETDVSFSVNLVTHESAGEPDEYLYPALEARFKDDISVRYVAQCGCGGHVVKVTILK